MCVMGIDAGNHETKVCVNGEVYSFLSNIGEYRERKLRDSFGRDDIEWEYNGEKGFAGTLAKFESEFGGTIKGKSKANSDAILRVLIAIHRYGNKRVKIVIGQPIDSHDEEEKAKLKDKLKGEHILTINNETKKLIIERVEIAPEGPSSILSNPKQGLIRIIDIGSGTINFGTLYDLRRIDKDSFTEKIGMETTKSKDLNEMSKLIYRIISGTWESNDEIFLTGGGAEKLYPYLSNLLSNCKVLKPRIGNKLYQVKYGNAIGFNVIAERLYN